MSEELTLILGYLAFAYVSAQLANSARTRWEDVSIRRHEGLVLTRDAIALSADDYHSSVRLFLLLSIVMIVMVGCAMVFQAIGFEAMLIFVIIAASMLWMTRQYLKELSRLFAVFEDKGAHDFGLARIVLVLWNLIRRGQIVDAATLNRDPTWRLPRMEIDAGI